MSLQTRITALATAIGADVKALRAADGDLSALATVAKSNLVAAINEIVTAVAAASNINDSAGNGDTTATWSADKIFDSIEAAKTAVKNEVLGGAAAAFDTLSELAAALGNDANFATTIAAEVANRVRYDSAQTLTSPQKVTARSNIGAAADADLTALSTAIGNPETDFSASYVTART